MQYYYQTGISGPRDPEEYQRFTYTKALKRDSMAIGILLVVIISLAFILSLVLAVTMIFTAGKYDKQSIYDYLQDGLISMSMIFLPSLIFLLTRPGEFNKLIPMKRNRQHTTFLFILLGFGVAIASNIFANIFQDVSTFFGVDPSVSIESQCSTVPEIILFYITTAIIPALGEEFAFRGVIYGTLAKYSSALAIIASSVLFGLLHGNFVQIFFAIPVGFILGLARKETGSMFAPMVIHCLNNAFSVTMTILYENEYFTEEMTDLINVTATFAIVFAGLIALVILLVKSRKKTEQFRFKDSDNIIPFSEKVRIVFYRPAIIVFMVFCMIESILTIFVNQ